MCCACLPKDVASSSRCSRPVLSNNYATLREIEGRLKSIKNIEKITKTMKIVASTRMSQAQRSMVQSRVYGKSSNKVFEEAEAQPVPSGQTLYIVSSSDKGLCGGVHSSLSKAVRLKLDANPQAHVVVLGEKCKSQLGRTHPNNMVLSFAGIGKDVPTFATAQAITDQIQQLPGNYDNIEIVYNSFLSPVSYEATTINAFCDESVKAAGMCVLLPGGEGDVSSDEENSDVKSLFIRERKNPCGNFPLPSF